MTPLRREGRVTAARTGHTAPQTVKCAGLLVLAAAVLLAALQGCRSVAPPKPLDQLTATEQSGHAVFVQHCSTCHHDRSDAPLNGPGLAGLYKKPYLPSGAPANDDRVRNTILHGRGNMPAQGYALTDDELHDLLQYLHTL